jgi:hypothetical protein
MSEDVVVVNKDELQAAISLMHYVVPQYGTYTINLPQYLSPEERGKMNVYPPGWQVLSILYKWLNQTPNT